MFTMKEKKKQTSDFALSYKKQIFRGGTDSIRQHENLPASAYFFQRHPGNSYMQSIIGDVQNTLLTSVLKNRYATVQGRFNNPALQHIKAENAGPSVEETPSEAETKEYLTEETTPEAEREETEETLAEPMAASIIEPITIVRSGTELWWFNGEDARNYDEEAKLTAWGGRPGATRGTFRWDVVRGRSIVDFQNNSNSMTRVNANRIGIKSTDASIMRGDVRVRCRWSLGGRSRTLYHDFTVFAPEHCLVVSGIDFARTNGFLTLYVMEVYDQFVNRLPKRVEVNEYYGNWTSDFAGENWPTPRSRGAMTGPTPRAQFRDIYSVWAPPGRWRPNPVNPGARGSTTRVKHAEQYYRAGSTTIGRGRPIKTHTTQFYRGQARQI